MFRKISIICLLLVFVYCLSAVCAADLNETNNNLNINDESVKLSCVNDSYDDLNVVDDVCEIEDSGSPQSLNDNAGNLDFPNEFPPRPFINHTNFTLPNDFPDRPFVSFICNNSSCEVPGNCVPAGHKVISNILIVNDTNFTLPINIPGGPLVSLSCNNSSHSANDTGNITFYPFKNMKFPFNPIKIKKAIKEMLIKMFVLYLIHKIAKKINDDLKKSSGKYLTYV